MKIWILLALFVANSFAGFPIVRLKNISGDYNDEKGVAYADAAFYDLQNVKISHENIEVRFNKVKKNLVLSDPNTKVELQFDFSFLNVFKAFNFMGVDLISNPKDFKGTLQNVKLYVAPKEYSLENILLSSDITHVTRDEREISILDGFIINGNMAIEKISFGQIPDEVIYQEILEENSAAKQELEKQFKFINNLPLIVRYIKLDIKDQAFNGSLLLDSWLNGRVYLNGTIKHDSKTAILEINLNRAKLGIFSIRKMLLNSVRRLELDSIKVEGNIITVDLGKVMTSGRGSSSK